MYVVDASAVLAVLLGEDGRENVEPHLPGAEMSIVNLCEVLTTTVEKGGEPEVAERVIASYGVRIRAFREAHAMEAAKLRPVTKAFGLGLGDRVCLAQGLLSDRPILTADRDWALVDLGPGFDIRLIR
jgi:PIN domain nuclease of toxin-antitoxin system